MKPTDLQNGMRVQARFARLVNPDNGIPQWSEWQDVTLFVRRRVKEYKTRGHQTASYKAGAIIELVARDDWASYDEDDFHNGEWLAEDYRMELRPLQDG